MAQLTDTSGVVVFEGTITGAGGGIPQGGPLSQDLLSGDYYLRGADGSGAEGGRVQAAGQTSGDGGSVTVTGGNGAAGKSGGQLSIRGGNGDDGNDDAASMLLNGGDGVGGDGKALLFTAGSAGEAGQALVSDGAAFLKYGGVQTAAGVPVGAPTGLPFAYDTTAVTGGFYYWNGAAWVKVATIL